MLKTVNFMLCYSATILKNGGAGGGEGQKRKEGKAWQIAGIITLLFKLSEWLLRRWSADRYFRNCDAVGFSSPSLHPHVRGCQGLGKGDWGGTANGFRVSFSGAGNVLELVLMVVQLCECTNPVKPLNCTSEKSELYGLGIRSQ